MATTKKTRLVLLDAHAIIHRAYHALPGLTAPNGDPVGALYGVITMVLKIAQELSPDYLVACFDLPQPTHRHEAFEAYKGTRSALEQDLIVQLERTKELMDVFGIPRYECAGFEADDLLGTIAEQVRAHEDLEVIIASGDMDTLQLVDKKRVQVYTLKKGINDTILYDESAVKARFGFPPLLIPDYKGLRGDPSDNIPGIKGIGEKTATTLITTFGDLDKMYKKLAQSDEAFREVKVTPRVIGLLRDGEDEARFSKALATISRDAPITFALPDTSWREGVDSEKVMTWCAELGFRSLIPRLAQTFEAAREESEEDLSEDEMEETALALWLLMSDHTNPSKDDMLAYGRTRGVVGMHASREQILKDLAATPMQNVLDTIERPLRGVLARMRETGIAVDVAELKKLSERFHAELDALTAEIYAAAGAEFNINSPKQLGEVLFDTLGIGTKSRTKKTSTGQRTTKESELEKMRDEHPVIAHVLKYRELQKLVGTYIDTFPNLVKEDGRIHSHFLQAGTTTGRLASRDPNLQNIPTRTEQGRMIRNAFIAPSGYLLVAFDYAQIELRIAAFLAEDTELMRIFKAGEDIHTSVAARVFNVDAAEVTKDMRRHAKVINFGIMYGMGVSALRENLGKDTSRETAQQYLDAYFASFPQLAAYLEDTKTFARRNGYTQTPYGRRRYFAGINSTVPFIRASAERMAINAPIQGMEADVVRIAMIQADTFIEKEGLRDSVRLLLQIHDELIFEIKEDIVAEIAPKLKHILETIVPADITKNVPLEVGTKTGKSWGELE
ncbi:hypothetical protein A3C89_00180 [Candidatus Kaiserbacteria bacterium RIFCSPHIGHO2_02_FULL_50_50]|uniref:DNA-directed DNA polymerase n=1 Tax=Candidatus Kaiserbacteria bacterium RIFCSPHIGHO2_02_FULL_50_50 TaxID=1798492 RepID=A0A1F6DDV7_9BACT|nr:MAG: hypothetical protein A3C89_00180 [Candidatus Kaiserbacteria bacterium RIFCSPHIGHO2_02_FULL_50_50]OGG88683.1 MAG: hypothetical protein A3G62_02040 [Candidatus Kaiserbacteria bacterium RIFCSPLOWO2_12_FULL_50_10]